MSGIHFTFTDHTAPNKVKEKLQAAAENKTGRSMGKTTFAEPLKPSARTRHACLTDEV
jgi:hypothetical protein